MKVAGYFLKNVTFDDFVRDYIRGYEDGLIETSKPVMEFAEGIKLAVEACTNGYGVSEDRQKDYLDGANIYLEKVRIRQKIIKKSRMCENPTTEVCRDCIASEICEHKKS